MSYVLKAIASLETQFWTDLQGSPSLEDIHEFAMRVARFASRYRGGFGQYVGEAGEERWARKHFPLTRKVLREEPVPGTEWPKYRVVVDGRPEAKEAAQCGWRWVDAIGTTDSGLALMRHLLDLHDNPYREEEL
jgi:hypothetical protein